MFLLSECLIGAAQVPAFPGAEGFGTSTAGGRGGNVIWVTNLNDRGPGSLREAINARGARMVVFAVGGIIDLETKLIINNPWVTIAGQTAPGDGICIRGEGIKVETHDVVIRYLRVRPGDIDFGPPNDWGHVDAISIWGKDSTYNVIIDHCSLSWAVDENIDMWEHAHDITIQYCIISEALNRSKHPTGAHGMGMLIGSKATNISVHHNLFAHNSDRNPLINGVSRVDIRNNVIYNPARAAVDLTGRRGQRINLVNNYFLRGPLTNIKADVQLREADPETPMLFIAGNLGTNQRTVTPDNWLLIRDITQRIPNRSVQLDQPFPHPPVTTQSAPEAYERVLREAGATLPRRDAVDRKIVRDINERGGITVNRKRNPLGWPPFRRGTPPTDADRDGMPDYWEELYGLSSRQPDDRKDEDQDGYTNIEEYLNGTDPLRAANSADFAPQGRTASFVDPLYDRFEPTLRQNYPNPFAKTTRVKFTIDRASSVSLSIFDLMGHQVANLVQELLYEGEYEFQWDASRISPGVYVISLSTPDFSRSTKAVITR